MDSEIAFDYSPRFRVFKNGRIERLKPEIFVPPSLNIENGVVSKDAVYSPEKNLSLRIYLPQNPGEKKIPLLVYFHGGGFITETAFSPTYHNFLNSAVSAAGCIAVSVDYRRAPEHPIPIAYEDSWEAIKWILTHIAGSGPEDWLNKHADFSKVFLAGDSAGANIAHHMVMKSVKDKLSPGNFKISGLILSHPYFLSKALIEEMELGGGRYYEGLWKIASPNSENGVKDPWINVDGSDLSGLGCGRVLVLVAGNDPLASGGWGYAATLEKSGWEGKLQVMETKDVGHVFHLLNPHSDHARRHLQSFAEFVKDQTKVQSAEIVLRKRDDGVVRQERWIKWIAPEEGWLKVNTDGASHGNPGLATAGGSIRDSTGAWCGGFSLNIGICTAPMAEL